jgi:hypothetical protein
MPTYKEYRAEYKKRYNGIVNDMKAGVFSPPLIGKHKLDRNYVDKKLAKKWATIQTVINLR